MFPNKIVRKLKRPENWCPVIWSPAVSDTKALHFQKDTKKKNWIFF